MNKLLILNSFTKSELNSLRNNGITMKLGLQTFLAVATQGQSEMKSYLNNGYDLINRFAKFERFFSRSINIPSFMNVRGQSKYSIHIWVNCIYCDFCQACLLPNSISGSAFQQSLAIIRCIT